MVDEKNKKNYNDDDEKDNFERRDNQYHLPEYSRLIHFPNFKSKLAKKLSVKRDILITKKSLEENKEGTKKKNQAYLNFLDAEIKLIQNLLDNKEINDEI